MTTEELRALVFDVASLDTRSERSDDLANYHPNQPRDPKGRFAHTGGRGSGAGAASHLMPPVVLTKTQRLALTKEEDRQWRAAWKERAALKASLKKETDAHARGQAERRVEELTRELQKVRDAGKQRSEGDVGKKQAEDDLLKKHVDQEKEKQGQQDKQKEETGAEKKSSLTRQEVTDRLRNAGTAAGLAHTLAESARRAVQSDEVLRIMGEHGREVGDVTRHGMTNAKRMHEIEIEGIKFQWPGNHPDAQRNAAQSLAGLLSGVSGTVPEKLWSATKTVVFSTQRSKDDDHWAREYNSPGFKSAATGGDGHVVAYNTEKHPVSYGTFTHEFGHNLAFREWGQTSPPAHTDYGKAQKLESAVSAYGAKSPAEDFAEAARMYSNVRTRKTLKYDFPRKYAAVHALLGEPPEPVS